MKHISVKKIPTDKETSLDRTSNNVFSVYDMHVGSKPYDIVQNYRSALTCELFSIKAKDSNKVHSQCAQGHRAAVGPRTNVCEPTAADVGSMTLCKLGCYEK